MESYTYGSLGLTRSGLYRFRTPIAMKFPRRAQRGNCSPLVRG